MSKIKAGLNNRQHAIVLSFQSIKDSGRELVTQYELTLKEYWDIDRRSCDNLQFFLNAAKRFPRLQAAARKLMAMYVPVQITHTKAGYVVKNRTDVSLKAKAKLRLNLQELVNLQLTSLLSHPSIKVEVVFEWTPQRAASYKSTCSQLLSKGVEPAELLSLLNAAIEEKRVAEAANVKAAELDVVEPIICEEPAAAAVIVEDAPPKVVELPAFKPQFVEPHVSHLIGKGRVEQHQQPEVADLLQAQHG